MLSYQHSYHAGGPADVHKHVALVLLLRHLTAKAKPASVIDLYAGNGVYALTAPAAQKTGEYQEGIAKLWAEKNPPAALGRYLDTVKRLNPGELSLYPGSPDIARQMLRPEDRLILNELHPAAFTALKGWVGHDARIAVHKRDGLEALLALVPPAIRRGLVLIDPSFEMKTDYADIPERLATAVAKWREGIFMVWYPVLPDARHRPLLNGIADIPAPSFCAELTFKTASSDKGPADKGLRGTGVIVINPPWKFDSEMAEAGKALAKALGATHFERWLRPESQDARG
jgi:23S rRNA (adenine2030-N6)-methyltransferase